jgi:hypothetical protein
MVGPILLPIELPKSIYLLAEGLGGEEQRHDNTASSDASSLAYECPSFEVVEACQVSHIEEDEISLPGAGAATTFCAINCIRGGRHGLS